MNKLKFKNIFLILVCISIVGLIYIFPVLGDDLLHGSVGNGINFMEGVNGRYLGNFFGINLSSNILLRTIIKSFILVAITYLIYRNVSEKKDKNLLILATLLILIMPKEIFRQIIVNTSGFCNYVFPIFGILLILFSHFKLLNKSCSKIFCLPLLILGFVNSLFVEHVTIYNLMLCIYLLIYSIHNKKNRLLYLFYTIGSILGSFLMFSNPIYLTSFLGTDNYRSITPIKELITKFCEIVDSAFYQNIIIVIILFIISIIIIRKFTLNKFNCINKYILSYNCIFASFYFIDLINPNWYIFNSTEIHYYVKIILTILFYISLIIITITSNFHKKEKHFLLLNLISYLLIMAPLLLVNPIGPRCYFAGYIFVILFILKIFTIMINNNLIDIKLIEIFSICFIIVTIFFYYDIYVTIYNSSEKRINNIISQISEGATEVDFPSLPYNEYLHGAEVCPEYNVNVYKIYYNIDPTIKFISSGC